MEPFATSRRELVRVQKVGKGNKNMEGLNTHCSAMATQLQAAPARLNCFVVCSCAFRCPTHVITDSLISTHFKQRYINLFILLSLTVI